MSSPRITRSAARAQAQAISPDSVQEVNAHVPPVIVIAEVKSEPINVIAPMPPAAPIEEAAAVAPALSIMASKFHCFVSIRYNNSENNERVDIVYKDHNLYISETYTDIDNKSQVMRNLATTNQIQKWLTLWFTSALLDEFSAWKCVDVYFSMLPSIRINRQSLTRERVSVLIPHIMESIQLLYDLSA